MAAPERVGRNPWVSRAMYGKTAAAFGEYGVYYSEYRDADAEPPIPCPEGHQAYRKSSVGAFICPTCGLMRCVDSTWRLSPAFYQPKERAEMNNEYKQEGI